MQTALSSRTQLTGSRASTLARPCIAAPRIAAQPVSRQASGKHSAPEPEQKPAALAAVAALAACMVLSSGLAPLDAEAARSSGRVGGSSGFRAAPRSAPAPRAAAPSRGPTYNNYNMSAPSLGGGLPMMGGYGGGISVFPSFGYGYGGGLGLGGGFFNIIAGLFVFSAVSGLVRSIFSRRNKDDDLE